MQFFRGPKASIPTLKEGGPGWVTDEKRIYVGTGTENVAMPNMEDLNNVGSFYVTVTGSEGTYSSDRGAKEIYEAYQANKAVFAKVGGNVIPLTQISSTGTDSVTYSAQFDLVSTIEGYQNVLITETVSGGSSTASHVYVLDNQQDAEAISYDGATSGLTAENVQAAIDEIDSEKQDKLTGTQGQVVGFDSSGNAVAQEAPQTGLTQEQADQRYLQLMGGTTSGNIGVLTGGSKLEMQVNASGKTQTLAFIDNERGSAYINNAGGIITISSDSGFLLRTRNRDWVLISGKFVASAKPTDDDDLTNKAYVDGKIMAFGPQTVASSAWASDSTYSDYPYRAAVALSGVTANHAPIVNFSNADSLSGKLSPVSESYNGGVYIYATEALAETVNIGSVICVKVVGT